MYPLHNTDILWVETNLFKGGKENVHYVPDKSYQRFKQLWIPDQRNFKKTGADPKTIRKYLSQEDFSPAPPVVQTQPSKLDPFKPVIQEWLDEDKKHWRKQHHTAQRIYERLVEEQRYTGSYSVVQRYLKKCRSVQTEKANLELVWDPGLAQVDFGEADFYESGKLIRKKYLTLSFPYSNDGYSQVFGGETAECVCQGLVDIFEFIGGVPPLLIFDNATGVGRSRLVS